MRLSVYHRTGYEYSEPVSGSSNELRLTPKETAHQKVESSLIYVLPATPLASYQDLNHNRVHRFTIPQPHKRLVIESRFRVQTEPTLDINKLPYGFHFDQLRGCLEDEVCHLFLQNSTYVETTPDVWRQALDIRDQSDDVLETAYALMEHIYNNYTYDTATTTVTTHASEVIRKRSGVCQDFAQAMLALCRSLKIPARYVSGYFYDRTRDRSLRGSEATHAWVEVYLGEHGWVGLDPTNRKVVDETYIILARGRDYGDVAPVTGSYYGGADGTLSIDVQVEWLPEK